MTPSKETYPKAPGHIVPEFEQHPQLKQVYDHQIAHFVPRTALVDVSLVITVNIDENLKANPKNACHPIAPINTK